MSLPPISLAPVFPGFSLFFLWDFRRVRADYARVLKSSYMPWRSFDCHFHDLILSSGVLVVFSHGTGGFHCCDTAHTKRSWGTMNFSSPLATLELSRNMFTTFLASAPCEDKPFSVNFFIKENASHLIVAFNHSIAEAISNLFATSPHSSVPWQHVILRCPFLSVVSRRRLTHS